MSVRNDFDAIAWFYDPLKRMVFGKSIDESQNYFLHRIKGGNLLILGGGSGEILLSIVETFPNAHIWYVEKSSKMIARAKKRLNNSNAKVQFIHGDETTLSPEMRFHTVITNFFLDLFPDQKVRSIAGMVGNWLADGGHWLITDFVDDSTWRRRVMLKIMYVFFELTCDIEARQLPAWEANVRTNGFSEMESKGFLGGFIRASVWVRRNGMVHH